MQDNRLGGEGTGTLNLAGDTHKMWAVAENRAR